MEEKETEKEIEKEYVSGLWKFKILTRHPLTNKWEGGVCIHNIVLNPIATIKSAYIKDDVEAFKVSKVYFNDGQHIYCPDRPSTIAKNLDWELFQVN